MPVICIMHMHALCILSRLRMCMGCLGHGLGGATYPHPAASGCRIVSLK